MEPLKLILLISIILTLGLLLLFTNDFELVHYSKYVLFPMIGFHFVWLATSIILLIKKRTLIRSIPLLAWIIITVAAFLLFDPSISGPPIPDLRCRAEATRACTTCSIANVTECAYEKFESSLIKRCKEQGTLLEKSEGIIDCESYIGKSG